MARVVRRAVNAFASIFGRGGGKGVISQNRAAKMGKSAAGRKKVALPKMGGKGAGSRAKGGGGGGGGG